MAEPPVSADLSLIRRLGPGAYDGEPLDAPYIALFERGEKSLIFVSGDHERGVDSAVARTIRHAFKRHKPRAVVVEGLRSGDDADAAERLGQAKVFAADHPEGFPENYYPIYLADRKGIPFAGGEPSLKAKLEALRPLGYSAEDLLGLMVAANVGALKADCSEDRDRCARMHDTMAARTSLELGLERDYRFADFERWHARRVGLGKPAHRLTADDCRPAGGPGANLLQTMAFHLELVREGAIVRQIETMLSRHGRVLVVYGSGHLVRQRPVWKRALGPSKDYKLF